MPENPLAEKIVALRSLLPAKQQGRQAMTDLAIDVARLELEHRQFRQCAEDMAMAAEFIDNLTGADQPPDEERLRIYGVYVPLLVADLRRARGLLTKEGGS